MTSAVRAVLGRSRGRRPAAPEAVSERESGRGRAQVGAADHDLAERLVAAVGLSVRPRCEPRVDALEDDRQLPVPEAT